MSQATPSTLADAFRRTVAARATEIALRTAGGGPTYTWADYADRVGLAAGELAAAGVKRGDMAVKAQRAGSPAPPELLAPLRAKLGLDQVRVAVTAAAPTPAETIEFVNAIGVPLVEGWGMSEVSGLGTLVPPGEVRTGTIGLPVPNPAWSRRFPGHDEILAYLRSVASSLGVASRVRLNARVTAATWTDGHWLIETENGQAYEADVLIPAVGQLGTPVLPAIPGTFAGVAVHTARWTDDLPVDGARIAVIGTGASAIQLVPAIADRAAHITVFQRTPPWTLPRPDRRYGAGRRFA